MFDMATHFPALKYIDLGSGFKVPYKEDEKEWISLMQKEIGTTISFAVS